jgi:hypothetical protein
MKRVEEMGTHMEAINLCPLHGLSTNTKMTVRTMTMIMKIPRLTKKDLATSYYILPTHHMAQKKKQK